MHPSVLLLLGLHFSFKGEATRLLTNINEISKYWGHLSPYTDNPSDLFGVEYTGLPAGCQIVWTINILCFLQLNGYHRNLSKLFNAILNDFLLFIVQMLTKSID